MKLQLGGIYIHSWINLIESALFSQLTPIYPFLLHFKCLEVKYVILYGCNSNKRHFRKFWFLNETAGRRHIYTFLNKSDRISSQLKKIYPFLLHFKSIEVKYVLLYSSNSNWMHFEKFWFLNENYEAYIDSLNRFDRYRSLSVYTLQSYQLLNLF